MKFLSVLFTVALLVAAVVAAGDHPTLAPPHLHLAPLRDRRGPRLGDEATRSYRSGLHPPGLRPLDESGRWGARAATCPDRGRTRESQRGSHRNQGESPRCSLRRGTRGRQFEPTISWAASRRSVTSALKSPANGRVSHRGSHGFRPKAGLSPATLGTVCPNVAGETNGMRRENR